MVSANNAIYNTVGASISGVTNTLTVTNPSNTASSAARETIVVGGATAADPTLNWNVSGVTNWEMGIDNSDSDKWKLSQGTALGTNDTIVAFTAGQVLLPRQPAFLAVVTATQSNVTGDGTVYTVIFDSEIQDIGGNYNTATGTFTAPVAGTYFFTAAINMTGINVGHSSGIMDIVVNGTTFYHGNGGGPFQQSDGNNLDWMATVAVPLSAGNTVTSTINIAGGAKVVDVLGTVAVGQRVTHFSGWLLG
jgi:hypothetical protein